jgi:two-component system sensor histidine kinase YesM
VENAIIHGLEKTNRDGLIRIKACGIGDHLFCYISDNGNGIGKQRLDEINERLSEKLKDHINSKKGNNSIGILNINFRIKLHFGEQYGISIKSCEGQGTNVQLDIPLIFPNEGTDECTSKNSS